jgi:hypothetical protein
MLIVENRTEGGLKGLRGCRHGWHRELTTVRSGESAGRQVLLVIEEAIAGCVRTAIALYHEPSFSMTPALVMGESMVWRGVVVAMFRRFTTSLGQE